MIHAKSQDYFTNILQYNFHKFGCHVNTYELMRNVYLSMGMLIFVVITLLKSKNTICEYSSQLITQTLIISNLRFILLMINNLIVNMGRLTILLLELFMKILEKVILFLLTTFIYFHICKPEYQHRTSDNVRQKTGLCPTKCT